MATLKNLDSIIEQSGFKTSREFMIKLFPDAKASNEYEKQLLNRNYNNLKKGKSVKLDVLQRISEITNTDYNQILGYE